jgi:hypothetical protein
VSATFCMETKYIVEVLLVQKRWENCKGGPLIRCSTSCFDVILSISISHPYSDKVVCCFLSSSPPPFILICLMIYLSSSKLTTTHACMQREKLHKISLWIWGQLQTMYKIVVGHMQVSSQKDSSNPYHQNYHKALVVVLVPTCSCGLLLVGANCINFFQLRYNCAITKSWSLPNTWHNATTCVCSPCSSGHIQGPKLELALYFITFVHIIQHLGWPSTLSQVNTHWPPKSLINSFLLPFYLTILEVLVRNLVQSTHLWMGLQIQS